METKPLSVIWFASIFSQSVGCLFICCVLCCAKAFEFKQVPFVYFCIYFHYSGDRLRKMLPWFIAESVLPMLFSKSFIVSGLAFRSLAYFELIFMYGVTEWSNFIFCMSIYSFFSNFYWRDCSLSLCILGVFVEGQFTVYMWVLFHWSDYYSLIKLEIR